MHSMMAAPPERTGFPVRTHLLQYMVNLLKRRYPLCDLFDLVWTIWSLAACQEFKRWVRGHVKKTKRRTGAVLVDSRFAKCMENMLEHSECQPEDYTRPLTIASVRRKMLAMTRRELAESNRGRIPRAADPLYQLKQVFCLTDAEMQMVQFLACRSELDEFDKLFDHNGYTGFIPLVHMATGIRPHLIHSVLKKGGTLIRSGLVDISKPLCCYKMDNGVLEFLFGGADRSLLDTYCKVYTGPIHPMGSFSVPPEAGAIVCRLLKRADRCHILLYGRAGTGKTEYAKSVAMSCGMTPYFTSVGDKGGTERGPALIVGKALSARK